VTIYRIVSPHFAAAVIVSSDMVLQSAPILAWSVGGTWGRLRSYAERKGWSVEPLPDAHVEWIDCEDASYEFVWNGNRCQRVTRHIDGYEPEDIDFEDLPDDVKTLIE